jgi:hypothetical protein
MIFRIENLKVIMSNRKRRVKKHRKRKKERKKKLDILFFKPQIHHDCLTYVVKIESINRKNLSKVSLVENIRIECKSPANFCKAIKMKIIRSFL